jgi:hypothetical protein
MKNEKLDTELLERLELVMDPNYEGEPLSTSDYILLTIAGVVIPATLMIWGWLA